MVTLNTFKGFPVSIPLGAVSLAGVSVSGVATTLTKNYPKKLAKLVDIVTIALAVFETSISKALNDGEVHEQEFATLQMFHFGVLYELANVDCKLEAETRPQLQKRLPEEINDLKNRQGS